MLISHLQECLQRVDQRTDLVNSLRRASVPLQFDFAAGSLEV